MGGSLGGRVVIKKESKFVLIIALFVSIGFFIIISNYVFNYNVYFQLLRDSKPVTYLFGTDDRKLNENNKIKLQNKEKFKDLSKKYADEILLSIQQHDYDKIYSEADEKMKENGSKTQFAAYMNSVNDTYGLLKDFNDKSCSINRENNEIKLDYSLFSSKFNKNICLTIWVRKTDKLSLSGIKFTENS